MTQPPRAVAAVAGSASDRQRAGPARPARRRGPQGDRPGGEPVVQRGGRRRPRPPPARCPPSPARAPARPPPSTLTAPSPMAPLGTARSTPPSPRACWVRAPRRSAAATVRATRCSGAGRPAASFHVAGPGAAPTPAARSADSDAGCPRRADEQRHAALAPVVRADHGGDRDRAPRSPLVRTTSRRPAGSAVPSGTAADPVIDSRRARPAGSPAPPVTAPQRSTWAARPGRARSAGSARPARSETRTERGRAQHRVGDRSRQPLRDARPGAPRRAGAPGWLPAGLSRASVGTAKAAWSAAPRSRVAR